MQALMENVMEEILLQLSNLLSQGSSVLWLRPVPLSTETIATLQPCLPSLPVCSCLPSLFCELWVGALFRSCCIIC